MTDVDFLRVGLQVAAATGLACALTRLGRVAVGRARALRATAAHESDPLSSRAAVTALLPPVLAGVTLLVLAVTWPGMTAPSSAGASGGTISVLLLWWLALPAVALVTLTYIGAADPSDLRAAAQACSALLDRGLAPDDDGGRGRRG